MVENNEGPGHNNAAATGDLTLSFLFATAGDRLELIFTVGGDTTINKVRLDMQEEFDVKIIEPR